MSKINKIDIGLKKISKIFHVSDVHIRNLKRHDEYRLVFNRLRDIILQQLEEDDIIYLAGDIVHAKTDMTPELIQEVQSFLKLCADIAPTILITGNHDCNLNNKSRLDALSPIVNALNHPNLFYLKDSGIYEIADKHFVVMSVFDKPKDFILASQFDAKYKIALHHGAVDTAVTDSGFTLVNDNVKLDIFNGYNLALLGDLHKPAQFLAPNIGYSGSLIQQRHDEALVHGMLVWDTRNTSVKFVEIPNDVCYYTLIIDNKKYTPISEDLIAKRIRLRLKINDTDSASLKRILTRLKTKFNIEEYTIQHTRSSSSDKSKIDKINIRDVRDVEYQNELISEYLTTKFMLDEEILDGVRHVNRTVNSSLAEFNSNKNILWVPKLFEFSNLFSFGPDNIINFDGMRGIYGLFAPNASGKSSVLDAITYCIFDKCSRTSRAASIMNNKSNSFYCKFNFELDGKNYFIEKYGKRGRGAHVRVDIDFYSVDELGNKESLNGKERSETNDQIRKILGTYEDFVLTALSVQNNNTGFIDMSQRDRKDLLAQFLDINIFEELYNIGNNDIKEVATIVKEYQRQDFSTQLANAIVDIQKNKKLHSTYLKEKEKLETKIEKLNSKIITLSSKLIQVSSNIKDITSLNELKEKATLLQTQIIELINQHNLSILELKKQIALTDTKMQIYDQNSFDLRIKEFDDIKLKINKIEIDIESAKVTLKNNLDKMGKLENLEYDEDCPYCMNNIFVKDAIQTKTNINETQLKYDTLLKEYDNLKLQAKEKSSVIDEKNEYSKLENLKNELILSQSKSETNLRDAEHKLDKVKSKIIEIDSNIKEYFQHKETIEKNELINLEISELTESIRILKSELKIVDQNILECHSNLLVSEKIKETNENSISKLREKEKEYKFYEYYLEAVSRDGVPYNLIMTTLPYIEQEINAILNQIVEFNIMLESDGKNINCYIVYDEDNFWPIELTSGMEKFISSLAIRTALINISSLPRPNFLAIDEGLGVLDVDLMAQFSLMLEYLKNQFEFIILISHIDSARDMVETIIEITKSNNFSKIHYV